MIHALRLTPDQRAVIADGAMAAFPNEACGLLVGHVSHGLASVESVLPTANIAPDPWRSFEIDPGELLRIQRHLRNESRPELNLIGVYHSHPNGIPYISPRDLERWTDWPELIWVIAAWSEGSRRVDLNAFFFSPQYPRNLAIIDG